MASEEKMKAIEPPISRPMNTFGSATLIGRDRFVRNVLYAIGNSGQPGLAPVAAGLVEDEDPAVADAARWACDRLRGKTWTG